MESLPQPALPASTTREETSEPIVLREHPGQLHFASAAEFQTAKDQFLNRLADLRWKITLGIKTMAVSSEIPQLLTDDTVLRVYVESVDQQLHKHRPRLTRDPRVRDICEPILLRDSTMTPPDRQRAVQEGTRRERPAWDNQVPAASLLGLPESPSRPTAETWRSLTTIRRAWELHHLIADFREAEPVRIDEVRPTDIVNAVNGDVGAWERLSTVARMGQAVTTASQPSGGEQPADDGERPEDPVKVLLRDRAKRKKKREDAEDRLAREEGDFERYLNAWLVLLRAV